MPAKYVFVHKENNSVYRENLDGFFEDADGHQANEAFLRDDPMYVKLNAYKLLQPTYEFAADTVFASSINAPEVYCVKDVDSDRCINTTDISKTEWFAEADYSSDYL